MVLLSNERSMSIHPSSVNCVWSYFRGVLSGVFRSCFLNLATAVTFLRSIPPIIIVMSAPLSMML